MKTTNQLKTAIRGFLLFSIIFLLCFIIINSCIESQKVSKEPIQTIENLKSAVNISLSSAAAYKAYSEKAHQEGFQVISKAFDDISLAKTIHARVYKNILTRRNINIDEKTDDISVGSTAENLRNAISFEENKFSDFLDYVNIAKQENFAEAETAFRWACDTEKKHKVRLNELLNTLVKK